MEPVRHHPCRIGDRDNGATAAAREIVGSDNAVAMVGSASLIECDLNGKYYAQESILSIPGIGVKSAQRLVLELRDKVGAIPGAAPAAGAGSAVTRPGEEPWRAPVTEALVGLGWSAKQSSDAVERVAASAPADAARMCAVDGV